MKIGYIIWGFGWLVLIAGIASIIMGIITSEIIGYVRGFTGLLLCGWFLMSGANRIQKARLQQLDRYEHDTG